MLYVEKRIKARITYNKIYNVQTKCLENLNIIYKWIMTTICCNPFRAVLFETQLYTCSRESVVLEYFVSHLYSIDNIIQLYNILYHYYHYEQI